MDVFLTKYMLFAAEELIRDCLVGSSQGQATVGKIKVGPRQVIVLSVKKRVVSSGVLGDASLGNVSVVLNGTEKGFIQHAPDGMANLTLTE